MPEYNPTQLERKAIRIRAEALKELETLEHIVKSQTAWGDLRLDPAYTMAVPLSDAAVMSSQADWRIKLQVKSMRGLIQEGVSRYMDDLRKLAAGHMILVDEMMKPEPEVVIPAAPVEEVSGEQSV